MKSPIDRRGIIRRDEGLGRPVCVPIEAINGNSGEGSRHNEDTPGRQLQVCGLLIRINLSPIRLLSPYEPGAIGAPRWHHVCTGETDPVTNSEILSVTRFAGERIG